MVGAGIAFAVGLLGAFHNPTNLGVTLYFPFAAYTGFKYPDIEVGFELREVLPGSDPRKRSAVINLGFDDKISKSGKLRLEFSPENGIILSGGGNFLIWEGGVRPLVSLKIELAVRLGTVVSRGLSGASNTSLKFDLEFKARLYPPLDFIGATRRFTLAQFDSSEGFSLDGLISSILEDN